MVTILESSHCVPPAHPSLAGHFPGAPVVPGVMLIGLVLADLRRVYPRCRVDGIRKLKFLQLLLPGESFTVAFEAPTASSVRFKCWKGAVLLAEGNLRMAAGGN